MFLKPYGRLSEAVEVQLKIYNVYFIEHTMDATLFVMILYLLFSALVLSIVVGHSGIDIYTLTFDNAVSSNGIRQLHEMAMFSLL